MSGVNEIRSTFLDFFERNGHARVDSSPLVPRNDPTLMFANSGMVQFKNVFTGVEKRPYSRATTAQKCVRAGGKHNDLDNVGYTARHHTFFEMLGNFSFGDYFKADAIELAWTLVTREFALAEDKLVVTVFSEDDEAFDLWKRIAGLPESRIIRIATSDNFWRMGDYGPCGPCSEIFYDHGEHVPGGPPGSDDADGDRFIEIWNLVFMQYEETPDRGRLDLPRPSIDTGMGLERIAATLQGTHDNYETDLMRALVRAAADAIGSDPEGPRKASHRVIADHLRACVFLVADGVLPSNEGRGYVLRRIMRRAMRHAELLGAREPVMFKLVPALVREMGAAYPELVRAQALATETLRLEEGRFRRTLERGLTILDEASRDLREGQALPGDVAFTLYDTYGFPLDLTQDALRAKGVGVDEAGFAAAMDAQKARARAAWAGTGETATDGLWFGLRERAGATEFLGYSTLQAEGQALALVREGTETDALDAGESGWLVVNQTPFYAESGGQVGDVGIVLGEGVRARVTDTQKRAGDLFAHAVTVAEGRLSVGAALALHVDATRRLSIRRNHSGTHLLHEALREVLGDHVAQKGSLVEPGRLRFDFSHPKPMTEEELARVEDLANEALLADTAVETRLMSLEDANRTGARALFGEKYGDEVRVVSMGPSVAHGEGMGERAFSVELCGGTHVGRTGEIGLITILSESGVAAGVRRLEALTGAAARAHLNEEARRLKQVGAALKTSVAEAPGRIAQLIEERRALERELADARRKLALGGGNAAGEDEVKTIAGVKLVGRALQGLDPRDLKGLVDEHKKRLGSGVVALIGVANDGRARLVVGVTPDLTGRIDAVTLVRLGAEALGGKGGGGRPDMAEAGGPDGTRALAALAAIEERLAAA